MTLLSLPVTDPAQAEIGITGHVLRVRHFNLEQLRALPATSTGPLEIRGWRSGRLLHPACNYRGVRLSALIELAQLRLDHWADFKRMVFVASAHDGYIVTFSWHEVFNSPLGERIIVAYEHDVAPLTDQAGAPWLISGADHRTAPRCVKYLKAIEVRLLEA